MREMLYEKGREDFSVNYYMFYWIHTSEKTIVINDIAMEV